MAEISPLHRVIDATRWDAERLLGRLIILVHAAFLDAGFLLHADSILKSGRVPTQAGATASTLPLVYAASRRQDAAVPLHIRAHGMHIVFYIYMPRFAKDPRPVHWVCVDALAAAPLLSRGLDDTARALTDDDDDACTVAALWRELTEKLCRSALAPCPRSAFLSLPVELVLEILARLRDDHDLLMVASTCAGLRSIVADLGRELRNGCKCFFLATTRRGDESKMFRPFYLVVKAYIIRLLRLATMGSNLSVT